MTRSGTISGRRRAAIAVVALGAERATHVMSAMSESEVRSLAAEVAELGPVSPAEVRSTLADIARGLGGIGTLPAPGRKFARELLVRALGVDRGEIMAYDLEVTKPFTWLAEADPRSAAAALASEPAGAVALALAHVEPRAATKLLTRLPLELRQQVAARLAGLDLVHPETLEEVEAGLRARLGNVLAVDVRRITGPELLAQMLSYAPVDQERALLQAVARNSPELAEAVRAALFTFDDVTELEPRTMQLVLKEIETRDLALALSSADEDVRVRVLANLSERAQLTLREEMELLTNVRSADVSEARRKIISVTRQLEEQGLIVIARDNVEEDVG